MRPRLQALFRPYGRRIENRPFLDEGLHARALRLCPLPRYHIGMMQYKYTHSQTEGSTGYFSCEPFPPLSLDAALTALAAAPLDDFLRRHILRRIINMPGRELREALSRSFPSSSLPPAIKALCAEAALLRPDLYDPSAAICPNTDAAENACESALIFLRRAALPKGGLHAAWAERLAENIRRHRAPNADAVKHLPPLFGKKAEEPAPATLAEIYAEAAAAAPARLEYTRPPAEETAALAEERLSAAGILAGQEMRHTASLSPVALLRPWNVRASVRLGRHNFSIEGQGTTYGRGLSVADARASCLMEMAERASMYLPIDEDGIGLRARPAPLRKSRLSELADSGLHAINPNEFRPDVPYADEPLHWMAGADASGRECLVPVQMAALFCNLDEVSLYDAPGSTGIATGATMEEAKIAALTEILERDAEAVCPFVKARCFALSVKEGPLARLLADYAARGVNVQFQDLTGPLGFPAYKAFVMSMKGEIFCGFGAGLNAGRAIVSALTETPFPYPDGGPSGPLLRKLPVVQWEELPDYTLGSPKRDLALIEEMLLRNGKMPVYADMTREDLKFPVVRALVPGMEPAVCENGLSPVPERLYWNYMQAAGLAGAVSL